MKHNLSDEDRRFRAQFEACEIAPEHFDHRAHIRLAYAFLVEQSEERALASIRTALHSFLNCHGVDPSKYHETMTRAWVLAVRHFMERSTACDSAKALIERNPALLDSGIMLTHYSADLLFSDAARERFVSPDLEAIPRHEA